MYDALEWLMLRVPPHSFMWKMLMELQQSVLKSLFPPIHGINSNSRTKLGDQSTHVLILWESRRRNLYWSFKKHVFYCVEIRSCHHLRRRLRLLVFATPRPELCGIHFPSICYSWMHLHLPLLQGFGNSEEGLHKSPSFPPRSIHSTKIHTLDSV